MRSALTSFVLTFLMLNCLTLAALAVPAGSRADAVKVCRADLARRLNVSETEILVDRVTPRVFADASLGLPRPGSLYVECETPGFLVLLKARRDTYLYATAAGKFAYGGSLASRQDSVAYVVPVEHDPNLNGNLVSVSLAGTNPCVLMRGVTDFYPQTSGGILATRRTSRSGFDLLYLPPHAVDHPVTLAGAFSFQDAVASPDGKHWAALVRPMIGLVWVLREGTLSGPVHASDLFSSGVALPTSEQPRHLYWTASGLVVEMGVHHYYERLGNTWHTLGQYMPPYTLSAMLNRSESLDVSQEGTAVRVSRRWFTGEDRFLATIPEFTMRHSQVAPNHRHVLICGESKGVERAVTVDILTGEVLDTLDRPYRDAQIVSRPPAKSR